MKWVFEKTYRACVGPEFTKWGPRFDIEHLDQTREVRRGDQEAVTAERGGGNYVGEGGDGGGRREGLGIEDFEGSGVSGGERVRR